MQVKDIMSNQIDHLSPTDTLKQAADELAQTIFGFLPVRDENSQLIGTLTLRNIVEAGVAKGKDPNRTPVREVMNNNVHFCFEDEEIQKAAQNMSENRVRHLVVLGRNKQITGTISFEHLALKGKNEQLTTQILNSVIA